MRKLSNLIQELARWALLYYNTRLKDNQIKAGTTQEWNHTFGSMSFQVE